MNPLPEQLREQVRDVIETTGERQELDDLIRLLEQKFSVTLTDRSDEIMHYYLEANSKNREKDSTPSPHSEQAIGDKIRLSSFKMTKPLSRIAS